MERTTVAHVKVHDPVQINTDSFSLSYNLIKETNTRQITPRNFVTTNCAFRERTISCFRFKLVCDSTGLFQSVVIMVAHLSFFPKGEIISNILTRLLCVRVGNPITLLANRVSNRICISLFWHEKFFFPVESNPKVLN